MTSTSATHGTGRPMQIRAACPTLPDTRQLSRSGVRTAARVAALFLFPYNTNNQNVRTRYWNGHDTMYRDDGTWIKGNHLTQLGGMYLLNVDTHKRNDNGQSINTYEQYLIGEGNSVSLGSLGIDMSGYVPAGVSANKYGNLYSMVLGMVDSTQGLFSRGLGSLTTGLPLNPQASCAISSVAATAACVSSPPLLSRSKIGRASCRDRVSACV